MGVGVGEFKSIRFSPMEGAGGGMLPLVEVLYLEWELGLEEEQQYH